MKNNRSNVSRMGKYISELRKQNGFTQKKLGEMLDVSDKTISKWELGTIAPDITILSSLAEVLGVSVEDLLNGEKKKVNDDLDTDNISTCTSSTRKKLFTDFIVLLFFFLIIIMFVVSLKGNKSLDFRNIKVDGDLTFRGFIVEKDNNSKIFFMDKFVLSSNEILVDASKISIVLLDKDKVVYEDQIVLCDNSSSCINLDNYYLMFEYDENVSYGDLALLFTLYYNLDKEMSYQISLF